MVKRENVSSRGIKNIEGQVLMLQHKLMNLQAIIEENFNILM